MQLRGSTARQEQVEVFEVNPNVDKPIPGMPYTGGMVRPCCADV